MRGIFLLSVAVLRIAFTATVSAQTPYATAGALNKDGTWEVGIVFSPDVDTNSVAVMENYNITGFTIDAVRFVSQNGAVILSVSNLETNAAYTVRVQNLLNKEGAALPAANLNFNTTGRSWGAIGANEPGYAFDAVAVGENGFDLVSGGTQFWHRYDESTFVYEQITGDFDKQVRVDSQSFSSPWARAGLMVRESLDFGKVRPTDPFNADQSFSRYLQVHVNPETDVEGFPANNQHEVLMRPLLPGVVGADEPTLLCSYDAAPFYPNAWLRLKRQGQNFFVFRSSNGTDWVPLNNCFTGSAAFTFPDPMPASLYVGVNFSPEVGNIPIQSGLRDSFLASFREYGDATGGGGPSDIVLDIKIVGNEVEISWNGSGTLESSTTLLSNSWQDVGTTNPYRTTPADKRFYRVRQ